MKYVKFGNTDMMVSECCAGTITWGSFNDKEDQAWEQMDALWYDNAYCRRLIVRRINVNLFRTRISGHAKKVSSA